MLLLSMVFGLVDLTPKDIRAMISFSKSLGVSSKVLSAVWDKNLEVRPEKDWEKLKGKAVV